ncbi:MAG: MalY/PatB family protein [Candidatus Hodarchaeales archaeon]
MDSNSKFNFDEIIDRRNTDSVKWGFLEKHYGDPDVIPLPVADMDFRIAQPIIDAIKERTEHGIFGYADVRNEYKQSVVNWFQRHHNWSIDPKWITTSSGVVPAFIVIQQCLTHPGDKILVQTPIYFPFLMSPRLGRQILNNPLKLTGNSYWMDFDDLKEKVKDKNLKVAFLCNPHNPVGRVWSKNEITEFGNICLEQDLIVFSDEVHCDLVYPGHKHTPFASISEEFAQQSITGTACSKSFNLAGLHNSNMIIPNPKIRHTFKQGMFRHAGHFGPNVLGLTATQAALEHGDEWLEALLIYLGENYTLLKSIEENLPGVKVLPLEGTYLAWIDFRVFDLKPKEIKEILQKEAKVGLDEGFKFGQGGEGFERINIACPKSILMEALDRIIKTFAPLLPKNKYSN